MDIRQLEYFLAIAEEKNLSKAADKVFISQPALSQYLIKLETDLNTKLFIRDQNTLILTNSGKVYLNGVKSVLSIKKEAEIKFDQLQSSNINKMVIGINKHLMSFFYTKVLPLNKYFNTKIIFNLQAINSTDTISLLNNHVIDFALVINNSSLADSESIHMKKLFDDEIVLICNKMSFFKKSLGTASEIISKLNAPIVLFKNNSKFRAVQESIISQYDITNSVLSEVDNYDSILKIISSNDSISLVPKSLLQNSDNYNVFEIFSETKIPVCLFYRQESAEVEPLRSFLSLIHKISF